MIYLSKHIKNMDGTEAEVIKNIKINFILIKINFILIKINDMNIRKSKI